NGTAHALVDDAVGNLAATEAGDVHLLRALAVGLVDARLELGERRVDAELDPGRVDGLDGALHSFPLVVCCGVRTAAEPSSRLRSGRTRTVIICGRAQPTAHPAQYYSPIRPIAES